MCELDTRLQRKPLGTEQEWIRRSGLIFPVIQELELVFGDWAEPENKLAFALGALGVWVVWPVLGGVF